MSDLRIGRYRVTRRIAEEPLQRRGDAGPTARTGERRLVVDAERQGDAAKRRLYVVDIADADARQLLADSLVACVQLQHPNVLAPVDAGVFGDRVYAAMVTDGGVSLAKLLAPLAKARADDREQMVAAIGVDVARGLQAGHDLAGRGLVHDALDLDSIFVDMEGSARVDGVFLDPWIASETIARSAAPFVAPERWKAPAALSTDVYALASILDRVFGGPGPHPAIPIPTVVRARGRAPETRPRSAAEFATEVEDEKDRSNGRLLLATLVASIGAPTSVPRGRAPREIEAPPQTKRFGGLVPRIDAADIVEDEATVVERSPLFDEIDRAEAELKQKPAADESTPVSLDLSKVAGTLRSVLDTDDDDDVGGSTVVAPNWSAAMAKADASRETTEQRRGAPGTGGRSTEPSNPRQSSPAAGWEVKTGSRAFGRRTASGSQPLPPLAEIPKAPPFPSEPAIAHAAIPKGAGGLPILWTEDSSADSDARTRALNQAAGAPLAIPPPPVPVFPSSRPPPIEQALPDNAAALADLALLPAPKPPGPWLAIGVTCAVVAVVLVAILILSR